MNEEILAYKRLGRSSRILCLIIAGEPNASSMPGHEAEECFPPALRFQLGADGNLSSTPAEPIAADMRSGKDGRRDARLKVAAGIAGVGFDELKQRELQRQVRRAVGVSTAALLLLLAMAGLTVAAVLSRREAVQQRAVATAERDRAEQNFRDARDAVDRFYTKVSEEQLLKAEGLQPLRADLLREALDYYQRFLTQRKDDPAFALETAIVQRNVGGILSEVGDPDDALKATRDATISLERLHKNAPGDAQIIARLSECLGDEAVNLHRLNRSEEALAAHDRAISLFETLPDDSPDKTRTELQRLPMTKGAIEAQLGRFDDAAQAYERGIEAAEYEEREVAPLGLALEKNREGLLVSSVQDRSPAAEAGIRVGDTLTRIADIDVRELSDMGEVRTRLKIDSAIPVQMLRGGKVVECAIVPVHLGNFMLASTKYNLGYLYLERLRNADKAKPWLIAAVDEYRRTLLRPSPATPDIREGMAYAGGALGVCGYRLGDQELQEQGVREGVSASEENARANPAVPRYRSTLAVNLTNLAMLLKARGDLDGAAARCEEAAEHLKTALRLGGNLASDRLQLAQLLNNLGSIICARDGSEASLSIYESALETAAQLDGSDLASHSWSLAIAQLHRNYGTSLADTARTDDAAEAFETASKAYAEAIALVESPPAWLVQESASLDAAQTALLLRMGRVESAAAARRAFESHVDTLAEAPDGPSVAINTRIAAVESFIEVAMDLLPDDVVHAAELLHTADEQLENARRTADDTRTDESLAITLRNADWLIRSGRLRLAICSGDRVAAWKHMSSCLDATSIESLPIPTRVDLAAGLLAAGKDHELELLVRSLREAIEKDRSSRLEIARSLDVLRRCGVPEEDLARLTDLFGMAP